MRTQVEAFAAGADLFDLRELACEVAVLSLIPVVERCIERGPPQTARVVDNQVNNKNNEFSKRVLFALI